MTAKFLSRKYAKAVAIKDESRVLKSTASDLNALIKRKQDINRQNARRCGG